MSLRRLSGLGLFLALSGHAWAEPKGHDVDSILDRLERRLLDKERETLSFGAEDEQNVTTYQYQPEEIRPRLPEGGDLKEIAKAIGELEQDVESLSSRVEATKRRILEEAAIDNYVEVATTLTDTDAAAFRTLRVKLDGLVIYSLNEATGLWMAQNRIPLYSGPLEPGNHRLEFEARLVRRRQDNLPLNNDIYHLINQTFELAVPDGKARRAWNIKIETPSSSNYQAKADLETTTL